MILFSCYLSVPFSSGQWLLPSGMRRGCHVLAELSVPFSSGQWLLPWDKPRRAGSSKRLSVPFSSGQWLLLCSLLRLRLCCRLSVPFSSGQWLLRNILVRGRGMIAHAFSPLFIGAMVATGRLNERRLTAVGAFSRGNGCYCNPFAYAHIVLSVPFSSGQWLLHPGDILSIGAILATKVGF